MSDLPRWCCPACGKPVGYVGRALAWLLGTGIHNCDFALMRTHRVRPVGTRWKGSIVTVKGGVQVYDFSAAPDTAQDMDTLRRSDLATLRQIAAAGTRGVEAGDLISKDARRRLLRHGLIGVSQNHRMQTIYVITDRGYETVRYNTSTIDGSEGYERKRS